MQEWRKRTALLRKDWPNFKTQFTENYNNWRESQTTAAGTQYNTANAVTQVHVFKEETIATIANLATSTALDRATATQLSATNAQITAELQKTQERLVQALEKIAEISTGRTPLAPVAPSKPRRGKENDRSAPDCHYCWTYGYLCKHTDDKFPAPADGHQRFATARKQIGGSNIKQDDWVKRVSKIEKLTTQGHM